MHLHLAHTAPPIDTHLDRLFSDIERTERMRAARFMARVCVVLVWLTVLSVYRLVAS